MLREVSPSSVGEEIEKDYSLFSVKENGHVYRGEKTRLGVFIMDTSGGASYFGMCLPKIPLYLWRAAETFFNLVCRQRDTEAALQLFFDTEENKYFLYLPKQDVGYAAVTFERSIELEYNERFILVMDLHSHGRIPAFFSSVDDADELGTRLFAVFGGFFDRPLSLLRAGSGGFFKNLTPDAVIDGADGEDSGTVLDALAPLVERAKDMGLLRRKEG